MLPDDSIPRCILLIALIIAGGFFAGSETAFSYCNKIRMKRRAEEGSKGARRVVFITEHFDKTLTTLLIGTNVCYVSASVAATALAVQVWGSVGSVISTVVLTLLIFLFSETVPKNIARTNSDAFAVAVSLPILGFLFVLTPVTFLFTSLGSLLKKLLIRGIPEPTLTEDEFQAMIDDIEDEGIIEPDEGRLIKSAIDFSDTCASEIMVPLREMVAVSIDEAPESVREKLLSEKFSRIPVYRGAPENIVGVLHSKEFLQGILDGRPLRLRASMAPPYFIKPETKLDMLFEGLGRKRTHMAIIADPDGRALGFVTMENVLEALFGAIYDEDDIEDASSVSKGAAV